MAVYQPNAAIGNSHVLASLGANGELMTFLYPNIDFPQNLHEGMPAVYFEGEEGRAGRLVWTFEPAWESRQRYLGRTNIVETRLRHVETGMRVRIVDFVHPEEAILVRRFEVSNDGSRPLRSALLQYFNLQLGEVRHRNAVHFHPERGIGVAYWRNICLAIALNPRDEFGCGRVAADNSAKRQMEQGRLNKQQEEIGDIDVAVGWRQALKPGESAAYELVIAADSDEPAAAAKAEQALQRGWQHLYEETRQRWEEEAARAAPVRLPRDLEEAYYRCLLGLELLADAKTGSVVAAPEFDPFFERSGGYGYCWPRDGIEVCLGLETAGYPEYLARFLDWARRTQTPEGYWEQRYWLNGQRAPSWCLEEGSLQIDQTASVLFAIGEHARRVSGQERLNFLERMWEPASRAAGHLARAISPDTGLHGTASDLWETFHGSFTYSNGAICAALREAGWLAEEVGEETLAAEWSEAAEQVRRSLLSTLWLGDGFARGLDAEGRLDESVDSSALGLVTPFRVLRLEVDEDREKARRMVDTLVERIGVESNGGIALYRFEGDNYAGGGPSAVSTLWLARVMLALALAAKDDARAAAEYRARAEAAMRAVLASGTETGLLPEMMGPAPGTHWAVPHGWAMAAFVMAALLLDQVEKRMETNTGKQGEETDE